MFGKSPGERLPKSLLGWLLGHSRLSGVAKIGVPGCLLGVVFSDDSSRLAWFLLLIVSVVFVANDLLWNVTLEENQLTIGGFRKKSVSRSLIESAYVWQGLEAALNEDHMVALCLIDGSEHRIWESAMAAKHGLWVERINRWLENQS